MEQTDPPLLDAATRAALQKLADITTPSPVSWVPQTWGWVVMAVLLLLLVLWGLWRWRAHRAANRYRREALAELSAIKSRLAAPQDRAEMLAGIANLLKRTALGAWPRDAVASLSGDQWVAFLRKTAGPSGFPDDAARLLDDLEYRRPPDAIGEKQADAFAAAARDWIERHHVPA